MRTAYKVGAGACAMALAWGAAGWLKPLGSLLPMTGQMVSTTRAILEETRQLQDGVGKVQGNLQQLQRQEKLLEEQELLTQAVLTELRRQEQLNVGARNLLADILKTERTTVELTREADRASARTMQTVSANAREVDRLLSATARIETGSRGLDHQMDRLLVEMEGSAENFEVVGRVKAAAGAATERAGNWWNRVREWFKW